QCFPGRERKRVQHQIEPISLAPHLFEKCSDLIVAGHVAGEQRSFLPKLADQFLDIFFYTLTLIIKNQTRAGGGPRLRNCPGDAALVRDTKDDTSFYCHKFLGHRLESYADLTSHTHHNQYLHESDVNPTKASNSTT